MLLPGAGAGIGQDHRTDHDRVVDVPEKERQARAPCEHAGQGRAELVKNRRGKSTVVRSSLCCPPPRGRLGAGKTRFGTFKRAEHAFGALPPPAFGVGIHDLRRG